MQNALLIAGLASASVAGTTLGYWSASEYEERKLIRAYRAQAKACSDSEAFNTPILIMGIYRWVLEQAIARSSIADDPTKKHAKLWLVKGKQLEAMVLQAGLTGEVSRIGCAKTRRDLSIAGALIGFFVGVLFSELLALILCGLGFFAGFHALHVALKAEVEARTESVEQELAQLIEVLVLGLRSGLSFDKSLEFYCHYFSGGLARLCERMQTQWNHGLITREDGLRKIAKCYASSLLDRIIESIIRSLRFGTSLAETLSNAGAEIRITRKTKLEEKVAKAPVKMLIPIGTLILPAMLILILGPILLDLMSGF